MNLRALRLAAKRLLPCLLLLGVIAVSESCGSVPILVAQRIHSVMMELPEDVPGLQEYARSAYKEEGPPADIEASLVAATRAIRLDSSKPQSWHLAAKACAWLWDYGEDPYGIDPFGRGVRELDCVELGEEAVKRAPNDVHVRYTLALILGMRLQRASLAGVPFALGPFLDAARPLVKDAPDLDDGGPLRIVGALYLKAPAWPTGPGDLDRALELLEQAVEDHPDHPLNHLFYAEALMEDEDYEAAQRELKLARKKLNPQRFFWRTARYEEMIRNAEEELRYELE